MSRCRRLDTAQRRRARAAAFGRPWHRDRHFPLICALVARPPEGKIRIDPPDSAVRSELHDATVDLRDIAVTADRAIAVLEPTMQLLEASHAVTAIGVDACRNIHGRTDHLLLATLPVILGVHELVEDF